MSVFMKFKFADQYLNDFLSKQINGIETSIDQDGNFCYNADDEYEFEQFCCFVRDTLFESWQIFSLPIEEVDYYRSIFIDKNIKFFEEINNGVVEFLLDSETTLEY